MRYIDAHVHITPAHALGKKYEPAGSQQLAFGMTRKADGTIVQTLPPYMHDSQFTVETLVHMMDVYEVDRAVIMQTLMSADNGSVADAVRACPDRLAGAMVIEPVEDCLEQMEYWHGRGLNVIKFEMRSYTDERCYPDVRYTDRVMMDMFRKAGELGMTVTVDPAPVDFPVYQPDALEEAVSSFPETSFVLCHLGYPQPVDTPERKERWERMLAVCAHENCHVDVSAMSDLFDAEGWPYPTALDLFEYAVRRCGIEKFIWGSDIMGSLNRATYPQIRDMWRRTAFLSEADLERLYFRNAEEAYRLS